jgi:hypothetical protein
MSKPRTLADHPNTRGTAAVADVTTSQTDTTAGRLLKVGDFGVGGEVTTAIGTITNIDNLHTFISESAFGNQGLLEFSGVAGIPNGAYGVYVFPRSDRGMVLLFRNHVGDAEGEIYVTFRTTTKWQQPRRLFTQGTILGTVSQASGVPTGAIIERGNGNGEYVRSLTGRRSARAFLGCVCILRNTGATLGAQFPATFTSASSIFHCRKTSAQPTRE